MADLTADAPLRFWDNKLTSSEKWVLDNSSGKTIYKGQPMILDVGTDTVYLHGFVDGTTVVATDIFIGIAAEGKVVETGDTEVDNAILVYTFPTIIGFKSSVFTDADVGDPVRMSDSATLSTQIADNPQIGKIHRVRDGFCYVQLITPYICAGA